MNENREMTQEREGKILESAIKTWGEEAQIVVAIEEMSELTKALSKYLRYYVAEQGDHGQRLECKNFLSVKYVEICKRGSNYGEIS